MRTHAPAWPGSLAAGCATIAALLGALEAPREWRVVLLPLCLLLALAGLLLGVRGVVRSRSGLGHALGGLGLAPSLAVLGYVAYLLLRALAES